MSAPTQNPIWNATLTFQAVKADELLKRHVEIELWDMVMGGPHAEFVFLGVCTVDIHKALLDGDGAIWCRLEDQNDGAGNQGNASLDSSGNAKASSLRPVSLEVSNKANEWSKPTILGVETGHSSRLHRGEHMRSSSSDDVDSIGDPSSLLHPDHAWTSNSRRGSSQSEQLNVEQYQLGKDYSHSLPGSACGSRRSSFQDSQGNCDNSDSNIFNSLCLTGRRRSSCTRRDPHDEFSKSHKGSKSKLNRTLSASSSEKRLTDKKK